MIQTLVNLFKKDKFAPQIVETPQERDLGEICAEYLAQTKIENKAANRKKVLKAVMETALANSGKDSLFVSTFAGRFEIGHKANGDRFDAEACFLKFPSLRERFTKAATRFFCESR